MDRYDLVHVHFMVWEQAPPFQLKIKQIKSCDSFKNYMYMYRNDIALLLF